MRWLTWAWMYVQTQIPIITGALAATIPILTQRTRGRTAPNINAEQLFLLADRTWAGAGGWYDAFRVGRLSWEWWKYVSGLNPLPLQHASVADISRKD